MMNRCCGAEDFKAALVWAEKLPKKTQKRARKERGKKRARCMTTRKNPRGSLAAARLPLGFTLIEIMIALAATAILTTVAASVGTQIISATRTNLGRTVGDQESKLLSDYIGTQLQGVGGGQARPWHTIRVEDNFNAGSDRVAVFEIDPSMPECDVTSVSGVNLIFGGTPCCLDQNGDHVLDDPNLNNVNVTMVSKNGGSMSVLAHSFNVSGSNCQVNLPSGLQATGSTINGSTLSALDPSAVLFGTFKCYFLDPAAHVLNVQYDANKDGNLDSADIFPLADHVYDFQVALGYDVPLGDGVVFDGNSSSDEWLYNAAGDSFGSGGLTGVSVQDLRMVKVGIVVGVQVKNANTSFALLNRPSPIHFANTLLRAGVTTVMMRNLNLYQ